MIDCTALSYTLFRPPILHGWPQWCTAGDSQDRCLLGSGRPRLGRALLEAGALPDAACGGTVEVVVRDPGLVVLLVGAGGAGGLVARESSILEVRDGLLERRCPTLALARRTLLRVREERADPRRVDEVERAGEEGSEEEVEEDAVLRGRPVSTIHRYRRGGSALTSGDRRCSSAARRCSQSH